jgi:hypothetical protein
MWFHASKCFIPDGEMVLSADDLGIEPTSWDGDLAEARAQGWVRSDRVFIYPNETTDPAKHIDKFGKCSTPDRFFYEVDPVGELEADTTGALIADESFRCCLKAKVLRCIYRPDSP